MTTYTTRNEAIETEILAPLAGHESDYDIDAIADEVIGDYENGYAIQVTEDEFWGIVAKHDLTA
ncbi:hypothetical protein [Pseudoglutamicibacter cumminsii]|uniref:hypothetical protein n=1 Tax=Pseudoglutamicibacter cumminsii TaxID=156979 RepID=UPI001956DD13|nr:hypothetical protein [Pseudoglutamicibacter cumminsii]MBM7796898.1 hypothetical protein [Pseudoglutamicibacter cumminsii]